MSLKGRNIKYIHRGNKNDITEVKPILSPTRSHQQEEISKRRRSWKESNRFIFTMGTILGLVLAFYFGAHVHKQNKEYFENFVNFESLLEYVDDLKEVLPSGLPNVLPDFQFTSPKELTESFAVGKQLRKDFNLHEKHPVIIVPGVISTGIESWGLYGDEECSSEAHFRKRLWGSFYMLKTMVLDKSCWLKHVMLDPITGLDPQNFTLRAAQGFEAADFFVAGYWIWNKVLQNLGAIGYESNKMSTAAYDWRLAYLDLELRDQYFSKLKTQIELSYKLTGEKTVLIGHSMGSLIIFYFLSWVEASGKNYGNGGPHWVNQYIDSFVSISGTLLGAPKAVPALISGEVKDTIQLNVLAMYGLEKFFSRRERLDMLQTWGGIPSLLPKGGDIIWGNDFSVEDELHNNTDTFGNFIRFEKVNDAYLLDNMTMDHAIQYIINSSPTWLKHRINDQYSYGYALNEKELRENLKHHSHWTNPMEISLPNAPDMKIYCFYGVGNPTERAYTYKQGNKKFGLNTTIAYDTEHPVFFTDGDGTVPIVTQAIFHKWAQGKSPYNPANIKIKIVEIKHQPDRFDIRGGAKTAEHVDILGSTELNEYILKVAAGNGDSIKQRIYTNITKWVKEMNFPM